MYQSLEENTSGVPPPPINLNNIFPLTILSGWTTAATTDILKTYPMIRQVPLSDSRLGVHRVNSGTTHHVRTLSDGVANAWEAFYKAGSYKPSGEIKGGFGFYLKGPGDDNWTRKLSESREVVFGYALRFQQGFEFVKGGKLPGIFGGEGDKAFSCTGGRQDDRCSCFDLRLMWRAGGQGELYAYIPLLESNKRRLLAVPGSRQNPEYGFSVGRGSFKFSPGTWATIAQRVRLNDPGQENGGQTLVQGHDPAHRKDRPFSQGEIQLWVDGVSVISVKGLVLRSTEKAVVQGLHFETFFGGSSSEWASPRDQYAWFSNVSGAIIA